MREEVISSGGTLDPTPAASSVGASSRTRAYVGIIERTAPADNSKAASLSVAGVSALRSSKPSCRPWERGDLLRRLATFKPSNWSGKPKVASSLACAQKGWINIDVDKIACETCGTCLSLVLLPSWTLSEVESAVEAFAKQLDVGHEANCLWSGNSCPESLVQFPPTPQSALIGGYKDRCDGLLQFQILPLISASAVDQMCISRGPQLDRLLTQTQNFTSGEGGFKTEAIQEIESSQDGTLFRYSRAQKLISLCGWEPRWLPNVQDCEEHSAQSTRNVCSFGPAQAQVHISHDIGPSMKSHSVVRKKSGKNKMLAGDPRSDSRSPLLDCSLCGATVRIMDFLTIPRPVRYAPSIIDIPIASKKMALTRGASAASGINGWVAADDADKEQAEDRDEVATTDERKLIQNSDVDLNLTMAGGLSSAQVHRMQIPENVNYSDLGRDLIIGQPVGSEVGDRAASFESRGPCSRKRSLEIGRSSVDRPQLIQPADSLEGTVIDRDGDEVTDGKQFSSGPSKRARESDFFDSYCSPYHRDTSGAGPSHSVGLEIFSDANKVALSRQGSEQVVGFQSTRDSARASSVIAMDTIYHADDDDSMESVENFPGGVDDVHFPSSSTYGNIDMNETSELNYSNQGQQSSFRPAAEEAPGEMSVSSTNDEEEIFNAETVTAQGRHGFSFGISGGSVGMCASHEAEIHGTDVSVHRTDSVVGDVEPRAEDVEHQGQTGESAPGPGLMDEIVPYQENREDPHGDSQEMLFRSVERADSGSKIDGVMKAESVESGEKASQNQGMSHDNHAHPSLSCDANMCSGSETTKKGVTKAGKSSSVNNFPCVESADYAVFNGIGPPKGESNYEEGMEFDPISHHNKFCPWVNGNVAAAGSSSQGSGNNAECAALSGWQLTLDALDALQSQGHIPIQTMQSESAASMYKDDNRTPSQKPLRRHSMSRSHGHH